MHDGFDGFQLVIVRPGGELVQCFAILSFELDGPSQLFQLIEGTEESFREPTYFHSVVASTRNDEATELLAQVTMDLRQPPSSSDLTSDSLGCLKSPQADEKANDAEHIRKKRDKRSQATIHHISLWLFALFSQRPARP